MRMRIGFLGLGTMGEPIANNLRKAGHDLTVWNRTTSKAKHIVSKGGKLARSARECATGRDLVLTCLSDEKALDEVLEGPDGALAGLARDDTLVDLSTAGTRSARSVAKRVADRGATFLSAPILGSKTAAEQAQVVLLVGGPGAAREKARPALHAVSSRIIEIDEAVRRLLSEAVESGRGDKDVAAIADLFLEWAKAKSR